MIRTFAEKLVTGFPERAAQRALRSPRVRHREHVLRDAVPAPRIRPVGHGLLLHGAPPPRIRALLVLRSLPLFEHYGGREPNDGDRERNPEFPHGDHNRSRYSGMSYVPIFRFSTNTTLYDHDIHYMIKAVKLIMFFTWSNSEVNLRKQLFKQIQQGLN